MIVKGQQRRVKSRTGVRRWRYFSRLSTLDPRPSRNGLTLIELLVVIVILTTIVAAAIPILAPADSDRQLREATRTLNTYITGAQARAIVLRRPFGIALKRLSADTSKSDPQRANPNNPDNDNGVCLEVFYVEQQPPYAGFDANSRARIAFYTPAKASLYRGLRPLVRIQFLTRGTSLAQSADGLPPGWDADLFPEGTIRPGDVIEISGTQYRLLADLNDNDIETRLDSNGFFRADTGSAGTGKAVQIIASPINDTGQMLDMRHDDRGNEIGSSAIKRPPYFTLAAPYKILRQPTPTSDPPLQLPDGTAIDLRASGIGSSDFFYVPGVHDNSAGVMIMFAPEGRVQRVYFSRAPNNSEPFDAPVVDNIYLLLGRRENVPAPRVGNDSTLDSAAWNAAQTDDERRELRQPINWLRGESRWVVIGTQSGRIASIENAFVNPSALQAWGANEVNRNKQIFAAREFTRGMAQMGGR